MIAPKFRELMLAAQADAWRLRFWFSGPAQTPSRFELIAKIRNEILHEQPDIHWRVEEIILRNTDDAHALAAYEILDANRNGIVGYLEWP